MGTIADKLAYTKNAKNGIKAAIIEKGVNVPDSTPLGQYDDKILEISSGGGTVRKPIVVSYAAFEESSSTSITCSIGADAGDVILAMIVVRSALTLPSGFTLLNTSGKIETDQTLSFAYFNVTEGALQSFTMLQTTAARMYVNLIVLRNVQSVMYRSDLSAIATSAVASITAPKARSTNSYVVWAATANSWSAGTTAVQWSYSNDWFRYFASTSSTQPRLGTFIDFVDNGNTSVAPTFTPGSAGSTCLLGAVEVVPKTI